MLSLTHGACPRFTRAVLCTQQQINLFTEISFLSAPSSGIPLSILFPLIFLTPSAHAALVQVPSPNTTGGVSNNTLSAAAHLEIVNQLPDFNSPFAVRQQLEEPELERHSQTT